MSVKHEWMEDSEALGIAMEVVDKYCETFASIDLNKIRFLRVLGKKRGKAVRVMAVGFPYNIDINNLYYIIVNDMKWHELTDAQRNLLIYSGLYEIAPGGMDVESVNYGKKRKRDVEDFDEVIATAGGRYDWMRVGASGIRDILEVNDEGARAEQEDLSI